MMTAAIMLGSCSQSAENKILQSRIDSLEKQLAASYKPGFGEFMSGIQVHHAKLWFAAQNQNWKLADFEIHEITEAIEAIQQYETARPETNKIGMIHPALDSVNAAITKKNITEFESGYKLLTNTCNGCHQSVGFEFTKVKIPDSPPFNNQDFKPAGTDHSTK